MRHLIKLYGDFRRAVELSQRSGKKGFTLVELLIVIAIIAILAAIAIPQFSKYKERAYVAAMMNDAHNIIAAEESYYADTNKYFVCTKPSNTDNYKQVTCSGGKIKDGDVVLVEFSPDVDFDSNGKLQQSDCNGVPGYKFTLKHNKTNIKITYDSCTDKAPHKQTK